MKEYFVQNGSNLITVDGTNINFHKETGTWFIYNGEDIVCIAPLTSIITVKQITVD